MNCARCGTPIEDEYLCADCLAYAKANIPKIGDLTILISKEHYYKMLEAIKVMREGLYSISLGHSDVTIEEDAKLALTEAKKLLGDL